MAQADRVRIYNLVRLLLEEGDVIQSAEEQDGLAQDITTIYEDVRDQLFEAYVWNFTLTRTLIAAMVESPVFGWRYQYALPSDCIKLPYLTKNGAFEGEPILYERETFVAGEDPATTRVRVILTDEPAPLRVRYVARVEDERLFSPLFVGALAAKLALTLSHQLTGKQSYTERMKVQFDEAITLAVASNDVQGTKPRVITDHGAFVPSWIDERQ